MHPVDHKSDGAEREQQSQAQQAEGGLYQR